MDILRINFTDWPLPDSYLLEIGRVAALWVHLESLLNLCICKLAGFDNLDDPEAFSLVNNKSFSQRIDIFSALCKQSFQEYPNPNEYKGAVYRLQEAQKLSNDFIHYGMVVNPESGSVEMEKGTAKVGVSIFDLRRAYMHIHIGYRELYELELTQDIFPYWDPYGKHRSERP